MEAAPEELALAHSVQGPRRREPDSNAPLSHGSPHSWNHLRIKMGGGVCYSHPSTPDSYSHDLNHSSEQPHSSGTQTLHSHKTGHGGFTDPCGEDAHEGLHDHSLGNDSAPLFLPHLGGNYAWSCHTDQESQHDAESWKHGDDQTSFELRRDGLNEFGVKE